VSTSLSPEDGNRSSYRNVVFSSIWSPGLWTKPTNRLILCTAVRTLQILLGTVVSFCTGAKLGLLSPLRSVVFVFFLFSFSYIFHLYYSSLFIYSVSSLTSPLKVAGSIPDEVTGMYQLT
jgi:hypothetical protein